jgi:hypothetical protein
MTLDLVTPYIENKSMLMDSITKYFEKKLAKKILISDIKRHLGALTFPIQCLVIGGTTTTFCTIGEGENGKVTSLSTPLFLRKQDFEEFLLSIYDKTVKSLLISLAFELDSDFSGGESVSRLVRGGKGHIFDDLIGRDLVGETKKILPHLEHILIWNDQITLPVFQHLVNDKKNTLSLTNGTGVNISVSDSTSISILEPSGLVIFDPIKREKISIEELISGKYLFENYCKLKGDVNHETFAILLKQIDRDDVLESLIERSALLFSICIESVLQLKDIDNMIIDFDGSVLRHTNGYIDLMKNYLQIAMPRSIVDFVPAPSQIEMMSGVLR